MGGGMWQHTKNQEAEKQNKGYQFFDWMNAEYHIYIFSNKKLKQVKTKP